MQRKFFIFLLLITWFLSFLTFPILHSIFVDLTKEVRNLTTTKETESIWSKELRASTDISVPLNCHVSHQRSFLSQL